MKIILSCIFLLILSFTFGFCQDNAEFIISVEDQGSQATTGVAGVVSEGLSLEETLVNGEAYFLLKNGNGVGESVLLVRNIYNMR